jgi:hypothetical protein
VLVLVVEVYRLVAAVWSNGSHYPYTALLAGRRRLVACAWPMLSVLSNTSIPLTNLTCSLLGDAELERQFAVSSQPHAPSQSVLSNKDSPMYTTTTDHHCVTTAPTRKGPEDWLRDWSHLEVTLVHDGALD